MDASRLSGVEPALQLPADGGGLLVKSDAQIVSGRGHPSGVTSSPAGALIQWAGERVGLYLCTYVALWPPLGTSHVAAVARALACVWLVGCGRVHVPCGCALHLGLLVQRSTHMPTRIAVAYLSCHAV